MRTDVQITVTSYRIRFQNDRGPIRVETHGSVARARLRARRTFIDDCYSPQPMTYRPGAQLANTRASLFTLVGNPSNR
jgi:hypothetical protein